jgi:hypothetical protein
MNQILDLIKNNLDDQVVGALANQIGTDKSQASKATDSAVHILLSALNKNARNTNTNNGLLEAITKDHDGSILDDLMGFATGSSNLNSRTTNGSGILGHLLGDKMGNAAELIAKTSGLSSSKSKSMLEMLAPVVMGAVGRNLTQNKASANTNILSDLLGSAVNSASHDRKQQSMIEKLLDQDGDGSVIDDLLNIGMKFFSRK